jgi:hypothetical protein
MLAQFARSSEGVGKFVQSSYIAYLKRDVDTNGLNAFIASVQNGAQFWSVSIALLGADEFFSKGLLS